MAEIFDLRRQPDDIKQAFRARGIDPDDTLIVHDAAAGKTEMRSVKQLGESAIKTSLLEAAQVAGPTLVGTGAGALAMAALGAAGLPAGPVGTGVGLLAGIPAAVGAGVATRRAQDAVIQKFAPDFVTESELLRLANPRAATVGQIGGGVLGGGLNSIRGLISRAGGVKEAAKLAAVPTALGGGMEAAQELSTEGTIDPVRVGLSAAAGPFQVVNTRAAQFAQDIGEGLGRRIGGTIGGVLGREGQAAATAMAANRPPHVVAQDILAAHQRGEFTADSPLYKALAEELNQPHGSPDALVRAAQQLVEVNVRNSPTERAKLAANLWDAARVKNLPAAKLPNSPLETRLLELIGDGTVSSRDELVELARQPNLELAVTNLKRQKSEAAGGRPKTPAAARMTDDEVNVLLRMSPDVEPPNATALDRAILEGRKKGFISTAEDVRRLESAAAVGPDQLPAAMRGIWLEKQAAQASTAPTRTAADAAEAFERRDTAFFRDDFPKEVEDLSSVQTGLDTAEALIADRNTPEATKALWRNKLESGRRSLEQKWQKLLDKATGFYEAQANPLAVGRPAKDFTMRRGEGPTYTGPAKTYPVVEAEPQGQLPPPPQPRALLGRGAIWTPPPPTPKGLIGWIPPVPPREAVITPPPPTPRGLIGWPGEPGGPAATVVRPPDVMTTPPPPTPRGLLGWEGEQRPNPTGSQAPGRTEIRFSSLDPNQNFKKLAEWFAPGLKEFDPAAAELNLRKWAADSKVKAPGTDRPMRLYHLTTHVPGFTQINPDRADTGELGTHFGTLETVVNLRSTVSGYTPQAGKGRTNWVAEKKNAQLMPVYLNIRNPLRMPDIFPFGARSLRGDVERVNETVTDPKARAAIIQHIEDTYSGLDVSAADLRRTLEDLGYDGAVYNNTAEGGGDSWIAFRGGSQVKSATGNTGNYDVNNPDIRHSGVPQQTAANLVKAAAWIPRPLVRLIYDGTIGGHKVWAGTKSVVDRLRDYGPAGEIVADADFKIRHDATAVFNTAARAYIDAFSPLTVAERRRVDRYLNEAFDNDGRSLVILTPKEQAAVDKIRNDGLLYLATNGIVRGGPGIREGSMYREQKINPNYLPSVVNPKLRKILREQRGPEWQRLKSDWEAWYGQKLGMTPDEANVLLREYLTATGPASATDAAKFGALTKAEGVGLPPSWRADARTSLMYHAYRAAKNFAWFTHVQRNPQVAKIVGETDDGWGGQIDMSAAPLDSLAGTSAVEAWKRETNNHLVAAPDIADHLTRIATTFQLGPLTAIRDILGTPAHLLELVPGEDMGKIAQAFRNVVTTDVRAGMEKAGALRTAQPFEFNAATFSENALDRVLELARTVQGRNLLESTARQWAYETGRLVAAARFSKGDLGFFEKLKIPDWRQKAPEDLFNAVGSRFVESAQGTYSAAGLPAYLLNTDISQPLIRRMFSIQRWSVERFNNWYKRAWQPAAEEGDFKPLLKSVLGALATGSLLNAVQEALFDQKPPEMTWREFMKAEDKEMAYTLFSKLQNVGFAGLLSSIGLAAAKADKGEVPDHVTNLGWDLVAKAGVRTYQLLDAIQNRGAGGFSVFWDYLDALAKDNIQAWRLIQNSRRPDIGNREERIFRRQFGQGSVSGAIASRLSNPMDPLADFRAAATVEDAEAALPKVGRAFAKKPQLEPRIQSPMREVSAPPGQQSYYDFVGGLQGPAAGQVALRRDQQLNQLSLLKRQAILRLKWQAEVGGGPQ